jgi:phage tail tape-measure protein
MRKHMLALAATAAAVALPGYALAQAGTVAGAAAGAATGAVVGGPVGAVAGGIIGGTMGTVADPPPPEVRTYVVHEDRPSVTYEGDVVVGATLPQTVEVYPVPRYKQYDYTVINNKRVIVDPHTRKVIEVVR